MKTDKNIGIAFLLNLCFSIFEFIGGTLTGSVAIVSDAVHDLGDALSIGVSYMLEKKSKQKADDIYSYGYARFSVIGSVITTTILLVGSVLVIYHAIQRVLHPVEIHYNGMIFMGIFGVLVNFGAAYVTKSGDSLNQKAVNLHMLEDVLGWVVVLIGAIIMRFTDISIIDPILSIGVAGYILYNAIQNMQEVLQVFLEKTPKGIESKELLHHLLHIEGVQDVHHLHVWSIDGFNHCATLHVVCPASQAHAVKHAVRDELMEHGVGHVTIEQENPGEHCHDSSCVVHAVSAEHGHHHHHHHH